MTGRRGAASRRRVLSLHAHPGGRTSACHLKNFRGTLQADGFSGFDGWYVDRWVHEAAYWGHAGRKFYQLPICLVISRRLSVRCDDPGEHGMVRIIAM